MSETEKPKKKPTRHIIDVEHPGTSAPAATSRPVIVTNRPLLQDPMMVPKSDDTPEADSKDTEKVPEASGADATPSAGGKQVITPLEPSLSEDSDTDEVDEGKSPGSTAASPADAGDQKGHDTEPAPATDPAFGQPPDDTANSTSPPEGVKPPSNSLSDTPKSSVAKQAEAEAAAKAKHDAEIGQLVESKRYALPIKTVEQRKSKRFIVMGVGLALILIVVWLDVALDAGIIKLGGLDPPTHFFSN